MNRLDSISLAVLVGAACSSSSNLVVPEKSESIQITNGATLPAGMYDLGFRLIKSSPTAPCKDMLLTPSYPFKIEGVTIPLYIGSDDQEVAGTGCFSEFVYHPSTYKATFSTTENQFGTIEVDSDRKKIQIVLKTGLETILDRILPYEQDQAVINFITQDHPQNPYSGRINFIDGKLTYENHGVQGSEQISIPDIFEVGIMRLEHTGDFLTLRRVDGEPIIKTSGSVQVGDQTIFIESGYTAVINPAAFFEQNKNDRPELNIPYFTLGNSYTNNTKGLYWKFQQIIDEIHQISQRKKEPDTYVQCNDVCQGR